MLPLLLAIAAFLAAALLWIGSSRAGAHVFDRGSISNTAPTGLSLAYAYLGHQPGRTVRSLTTPLESGAVPRDAVVIRVEQGAPESEHEVEEEDDSQAKPAKGRDSLLTPAEEEFVRGGGRLILASDAPGRSLNTRHDAGTVATKVFSIWPEIDKLSLPEPRGLAARSLTRGMHTLFAANGEAVVARIEIGAGDLLVIAVPELFENENIAVDNHLALLMALTNAGNGHRPIYFDELVHGMASDDGVLALLTEWRLGPLLVLGAIAALLTFWRNSKRIGPAEDEDRDRRSDAVDLVASLGALYGQSMSSAQSIVLYHEALERSVAAQSGLRGDALHRRVAELTHGASLPAVGENLPAHAFHRHLTIINDAFRTLERSARGGQHANHR